MRDLFFFHDDNGTFADYTLDARDYIRDSISVDFTALEDYLYLGLYKPFYSSYMEFSTASALSQAITWEYWNGSAWTALSVNDETKNFSRSGFINWNRPLSDWAATTVNSEEKYWIRARLSLDETIVIQGWNIVFADDNDLAAEQRDMGTNRFKFKGDNSFIAYHVAARNEIVQSIRNSGNATRVDNSDQLNNFTKWDILDIGEIREAAKFLALSKINFDVSDNVDDKYYQRFSDYRNRFGEAYKLWFRSLDMDDDGVMDDDERLRARTVEVLKL